MNENPNSKAESESHLDQFVRQTLAGHRIEPSPGIWKEISRKLLWRELSRFNFSNITKKIWLMGGAGILVITAGIYFISPGSVRQPVTTSNRSQVIPVSLHSSGARNQTGNTDNLITTGPGNSTHSSISNTLPMKQEQKAVTEPSVSLLAKTEKESGTVDAVVSAMVAPTEENVLSNVASTDRTRWSEVHESGAILQPVHSISIITPMPSFGPGLLNIEIDPDTLIIIQTGDRINKILIPAAPSTTFFSASLGVEPEITFNPGVSTDFKVNGWITSRIAVHFSRFSISTGLDLGYISDESKYRIDYISKDSVGYFTSVVSYVVGNGNKIIYNTVTENIYDSVQHIADDRTRARYTFVQIPLLAGYRLYQSDLFSLAIHAGPVVSFLVNSREPEPEINYRNSRILKIENQTPPRNPVNWQLWVDLNLEFRMNKSLSLYLEPSCRYFINAPVQSENSNSKKSWSTGIGLGLHYKFGQNLNKKKSVSEDSGTKSR